MVKKHVHLRPIVGECVPVVTDESALEDLHPSIQSLLRTGYANFAVFQAAIERLLETFPTHEQLNSRRGIARALGFELHEDSSAEPV